MLDSKKVLDHHTIIPTIEFEKTELSALSEDYPGRSLSLSDVVVLHQDGDVSAHYVDTFEDDKHLIMGNGEQAFVVAALEAKAKAGEPISLVDLANAIKAEEKGGKSKPKEKKQSIRAQLKKDAGKEKATTKKAATKKKNNDLEV